MGIIFAGTALPEEILFRALIQNLLMRRLGTGTRTLLLASVIFGGAELAVHDRGDDRGGGVRQGVSGVGERVLVGGAAHDGGLDEALLVLRGEGEPSRRGLRWKAGGRAGVRRALPELVQRSEIRRFGDAGIDMSQDDIVAAAHCFAVQNVRLVLFLRRVSG